MAGAFRRPALGRLDARLLPGLADEMRWPRGVGQTRGLVPPGQLDQPLQGAHRVVHAGPRVAYLGKPGRHGSDREGRRITPRHLVPQQRRRYPGVGQRPDRIGGCDGAVLGVLVVIDEDAVPLLFPPFAGCDVGSAPLHLAGERHRGAADVGERPARLDPGVDVETAGPRRLRPGGQAEILQHRFGHDGHVHDLRPFDAGHRVEVDPQFIRVVEIIGAHRMRVEVDAAQVDHPGQLRRVADHDLAGGPAGREAQLDRLDPVRAAFRSPLLEERLALGAVHETLQRHRAPRDTAHRPVRHREVVANQVDLGVTGAREEDLVRIADGHFPPRCLHYRFSPRHVATVREPAPVRRSRSAACQRTLRPGKPGPV